MKIYTVSTFKGMSDWGLDGNRVVGYFRTLKKAQNIVENNLGDINENGYYSYALIEEVENGLYPYSPLAYFYKWDGRKFVQIDKPAELKCFVSFTMG